MAKKKKIILQLWRYHGDVKIEYLTRKKGDVLSSTPIDVEAGVAAQFELLSKHLPGNVCRLFLRKLSDKLLHDEQFKQAVNDGDGLRMAMQMAEAIDKFEE